MNLTGTLHKGDESKVPTAVLAGVRMYVLLNNELLIELWEGRIGPTQYGQRQQGTSKNVGEAVSGRQKQAKKRSLRVVNEHFEPVFNTAMTTQVVFRGALKS